MPPTKDHSTKHTGFVLMLGLSLPFLLIAFKVLALPFFILWLLLSFTHWGANHKKTVDCVWAIFFFGLLFLPFDIQAGPYVHGSRRGEGPHRPHLVRLVMGMPRHTRLIEKYGEYITGGCCVTGFEPKWILVWN
jgi:hypothetical protein